MKSLPSSSNKPTISIKTALASFIHKPTMSKKTGFTSFIGNLGGNDLRKLAKKMDCFEECNTYANNPDHYKELQGDLFEGEAMMTYYSLFEECLIKEWNK